MCEERRKQKTEDEKFRKKRFLFQDDSYSAWVVICEEVNVNCYPRLFVSAIAIDWKIVIFFYKYRRFSRFIEV